MINFIVALLQTSTLQRHNISTRSTMRPSIFFTQLTIFSLLVGALLFGLQYITQIADYQQFMLWSWGFFIFLCTLIYGMAWIGKKHDNHILNFRLGLFFNFLKIIASLVFVLFYYKQYQPATDLFVLPFFLIYTLYTIFELYFLTKLFNG